MITTEIISATPEQVERVEDLVALLNQVNKQILLSSPRFIETSPAEVLSALIIYTARYAHVAGADLPSVQALLKSLWEREGKIQALRRGEPLPEPTPKSLD